MVKVWRVRDLPRPGGAGDGGGEPGQAEGQGVRPGMMLVGINGDSILRQRNTWRETLLRLTNARRPVVLTFREIPKAAGLLAPLVSPAGTPWDIFEEGTLPAALQKQLDDLRTRPAGQWVLARYAEDR